MNTTTRISIAFILGLASYTHLFAANEDFLGSFSGTETITFSACTDHNDDGSSSGSWSITNFNLNGNNYDFRGINSFGTTFTGTATITGSLTTSFTGTCDGGICGFTGTSATSSDLNSFTVSSTGVTVAPSGIGTCNFSSKVAGTLNSDIVDPENTASTTVTTTPTTVAGEVRSISSDIGNRTQNALLGFKGRYSNLTSNGGMYEQTLGLAAGDTVIPFGVWTSFSYSDFENDFSSTAFDGDRKNILAGVDYSPFQDAILGIAVGYEFTDLDTTFNRGEAESEGFTVAPYFGMLIDDIWSIDASFGYSLIDTDQFRLEVGSNNRVSSSLDTDRWFGTVNINGNKQMGNWLIGGRMGLLFARSIQENFRESNGTRVAERTVELNNINVGGNISYFYESFEPFAMITYQNEFSSTVQKYSSIAQPEIDDDDILMTLGIRYFGNNGFSGNIEYSKRLLRSDYEEDSFNLTIRGEF